MMIDACALSTRALASVLKSRAELREQDEEMQEEMSCAICGETVSLLDVEHGNVAEMYDPKSAELRSDVVHAECGLARGWEVS